MTESLFRREVLDSRRGSWLGGISLAQPLRLWVLTAAASFTAALVVLFLFFGQYTRRSQVVGQLVPDRGLSTVVAPASGVVSGIFLEEGDRVKDGDAMALIDIPRTIASGVDALSRIREKLDAQRSSVALLGRSQTEQIDAQVTGQSRQLAEARRELRLIESEIATRHEQVRIGRETVQRYRSIVDQKYVSQVQLNQEQQSLLERLGQQQALERQATTIRRTIAQLEQSLRELPARRDAEQAITERDIAALDQEQVQQESSGQLLVKTPLAGMITNRLVEPGQAVQAGQSLFSLLPKNSQLQAQLFAPSRAVGFIKHGDRVLLRYHAFPFQKFGHQVGKVVRISRSAIDPPAGSEKSAEPYYRVFVSLDRQAITAYGKPESLRPGMQLDADILGERRRLYEWVLEPLYSLKGKIGN